jgi:hypothetical protein
MKLSQLRTTIEKNGKGKIKTNVLVPNKRVCVDGATIAATPTFSSAKQRWLFS